MRNPRNLSLQPGTLHRRTCPWPLLHRCQRCADSSFLVRTLRLLRSARVPLRQYTDSPSHRRKDPHCKTSSCQFRTRLRIVHGYHSKCTQPRYRTSSCPPYPPCRTCSSFHSRMILGRSQVPPNCLPPSYPIRTPPGTHTHPNRCTQSSGYLSTLVCILLYLAPTYHLPILD